MRIGVFDSGFGGLTIYASIQRRLPPYDYVYLGDNARSPYGHRSFDVIYRFTSEAVRFLLARDCALVVIACNTASARALRTVQQTLLPTTHPERRVLGIIRPLVESVAHFDRGRRIALWATPGTVQSGSYALELGKLRSDLQLVQVACPMLVPLVENGELEGPALEYFLRKYWAQTIRENGSLDALLLACTHYPLLLPAIRRIVPPATRVVVQGDIIASSLADYLERHSELERRLSRGGTSEFLTTDRSEAFDRLAELFLGERVSSRSVEL
jgi:glutamate racemase